METKRKESQRLRRHHRVRKKVVGTTERPRLVIHRSHLHLYAQIVDDRGGGRTLLSCSTRQPDFLKKHAKGGNVEAARHLGVIVAGQAAEVGIKQVVFDRGGYAYHGRVKALAEAAREKGLSL